MTVDTPMEMSLEDAYRAYAASKMTCINEEVGGTEFYNTLKPVELM
jgi:hypothetical protein